MVKPLVERQMRFRAKRKAQGGIRLDMWLPKEEAALLEKLRAWRGLRSYPQVFLSLIKEVWDREVEKAACEGYADAQFEFGVMCAIGEGVNCDYSEAEKWFIKSSEQGYHVDACFNNLGLLSHATNNFEEGIEWLQKSAEQGNKLALLNLGVLYMVGHGVQQDYCQAAEWFMKSAEWIMNIKSAIESAKKSAKPSPNGWITIEFKTDEVPSSSSILGILNLGVLYALGKGVPKDYATAIEFLGVAMEFLHNIGMIKIGINKNSMAYEDYLAHWLSTFPDECGIRDGDLAVTIAEKLVKKSKSTDYMYTLAEAYAEAGRFEDAIKTQKRLISKLKQRHQSKQLHTALQDCQNRLNSYINKKPWRDDYSSLSQILFGMRWDFSGCEHRL